MSTNEILLGRAVFGIKSIELLRLIFGLILAKINSQNQGLISNNFWAFDNRLISASRPLACLKLSKFSQYFNTTGRLILV